MIPTYDEGENMKLLSLELFEHYFLEEQIPTMLADFRNFFDAPFGVEGRTYVFVFFNSKNFVIFEGILSIWNNLVLITPGTVAKVYWEADRKAWFYEPNEHDLRTTSVSSIDCRLAPTWMCEQYDHVETA